MPCALALASLGCSVDAGPDPGATVVGDGALLVDWTIGDAKDPRDCSNQSADSIDVVVTTAAGDEAGDFNAYCNSFAIDIELAPGSYLGEASLLDANGRARTTPVDLGHFVVYGDDELSMPIDFPLDSFY
jgi:hypothetical protein